MKELKFAHYEAFDLAAEQVAKEMEGFHKRLAACADRPIKFAHYKAFDMAAEQVEKEMEGFRERLGLG